MALPNPLKPKAKADTASNAPTENDVDADVDADAGSTTNNDNTNTNNNANTDDADVTSVHSTSSEDSNNNDRIKLKFILKDGVSVEMRFRPEETIEEITDGLRRHWPKELSKDGNAPDSDRIRLICMGKGVLAPPDASLEALSMPIFPTHPTPVNVSVKPADIMNSPHHKYGNKNNNSSFKNMTSGLNIGGAMGLGMGRSGLGLNSRSNNSSSGNNGDGSGTGSGSGNRNGNASNANGRNGSGGSGTGNNAAGSSDCCCIIS